MSEMCKKHNIEKYEMSFPKPVEDDNGNWVYDTDGNPVMEDVSTFICPMCEEEENLKKYKTNNADIGTKPEEIPEVKNVSNDLKNTNSMDIKNQHLKNAFNNIPFYKNNYTMFKNNTHASDTLIYSEMQFIISLGLQNSFVSSEMGKVRPNIGIMGIFPSGYSKSPVLNNIKEVQKFWTFGDNNYIQNFERFSPEGIKSFINKNADKNKKYKMDIEEDEVSTMAKSTKNGIMSTSGLEFLSGLYDGRIDQHDTRMSGHETFPDEIYCPMWFTGTPTFWAHIIGDWWTQGIAYRMLYSLTGDMDTRGIKLKEPNTSLNIIKPFITSLTRISKFVPDEDFEQLYQQRTHEIKELQYEAVLKGRSEDIEILYYKKYPELILKLAMIHKAAMMEEPMEKLEQDELLEIQNTEYVFNLNKEDFEWAEQDFEMYKQGFIEAYESYVNAHSERYNETDTSFLENKFMKILKKLKNRKETYRIGKHNEIIKDEKGEWVKLSDIARESHWNKKDGDFVTDTLVNKDLIQKVICVSGNRTLSMIKLIL